MHVVCVTIAVSLGEIAEKLLFLAYNIRLPAELNTFQGRSSLRLNSL